MTTTRYKTWVGWTALVWMIGFGALHFVWAVMGLAGAGSFTGAGAVAVNVAYTVVSLVGALVVYSMIEPSRPLLPAWFVRLGARAGCAALTFVATLAAVHEVQALAGTSDQPVRWMVFEGYAQLGAVLFVPVAVRYLRRQPREGTLR